MHDVVWWKQKTNKYTFDFYRVLCEEREKDIECERMKNMDFITKVTDMVLSEHLIQTSLNYMRENVSISTFSAYIRYSSRRIVVSY